MYTPKAKAINLKKHFCVRFDDFRTENTCKWQLEMEKEGPRDRYETKEYIERRHGEPFKFLFLPKMGLLGSQAVLEKKVQF